MYPIDTNLKDHEISSMLNERIRMDKDLLRNLKKNSPMYEAYTRIVEVLEHMLSIVIEVETKHFDAIQEIKNIHDKNIIKRRKIFNE